MAEIGLFEAIHSARALRRYRPDPIPDEVMTKILDAAIRAPSGSNQQNWIFMVVRDSAKKQKIADIYRRGGEILMQLYANRERPAHVDEKQYNAMLNSATYLIGHMHEAPVLLFACLRQERAAAMPNLPPDIAKRAREMGRASGSSIYPAVQNIILACRAFGLGTVITTNHIRLEDEVKAVLGLPENVSTYALMPIGYPEGKFGPLSRRPVAEVAYLDRWGTAWAQ